MKSILICDDHALVREALAGTVQMSWPVARIALAGDVLTGWIRVGQGHDLIVCNLIMPGAGPLAGIDDMSRAAPACPVLA